ncbi:rna-directed dna polymerase from mobile element jockey-like [Pitangus sulphuratus]|nr:rna-directed dna polymerase from mobile element jockey-like [Pitangus sulphuratus]
MEIKEMTEDNTINFQSCSKEISGLRAKFIVAWVKERWIQWVSCLVEEELVGWSHPEGSGQWLKVPRDISDKWCPSGACIGTLFNIFINDMDKGLECTLSNFAEDIKLSGPVDTTEGWDAIQKGLDKLKKSVHGNVMTFNNVQQFKVLHLGQGNPQYQSRLEDEGIESSPAEKDLGY